jgi:electron transport complex protein RnfB
MIQGIVFLTILCLVLCGLLITAARLLEPDDAGLVAQIESILPRIQCAQCGFPGCRPYAQALARDEAEINRCPPGGEQTIRELARLLNRDPVPLDRSRGSASTSHVARIREAACIGCNLCAQACPVDAIAGVSQMMHTVIASDCTGCELCIPPCPVDCIDMLPRHARIHA